MINRPHPAGASGHYAQSNTIATPCQQAAILRQGAGLGRAPIPKRSRPPRPVGIKVGAPLVGALTRLVPRRAPQPQELDTPSVFGYNPTRVRDPPDPVGEFSSQLGEQSCLMYMQENY